MARSGPLAPEFALYSLCPLRHSENHRRPLAFDCSQRADLPNRTDRTAADALKPARVAYSCSHKSAHRNRLGYFQRISHIKANRIIETLSSGRWESNPRPAIRKCLKSLTEHPQFGRNWAHNSGRKSSLHTMTWAGERSGQFLSFQFTGKFFLTLPFIERAYGY
jgi:hypothetical protein